MNQGAARLPETRPERLVDERGGVWYDGCDKVGIPGAKGVEVKREEVAGGPKRGAFRAPLPPLRRMVVRVGA